MSHDTCPDNTTEELSALVLSTSANAQQIESESDLEQNKVTSRKSVVALLKRDKSYLLPAGMSKARFLQDVLSCSLGAYGGPEAHIGVLMDQMVVKHRYLSEEELVELIALCSILPGPTSTQTVVAIGYKTGGPLLALWAMLVWALPVLMLMTILSFLYQFMTVRNIPHDVLRYVGPMAVGFIVVAAWRIGHKVITDLPTGALMLFGAVITYFIRAPWIFPAVLVVGGVVSILLHVRRESGLLWNRVSIRPPWHYLVLFMVFALGAVVAASVSDNRLVQLFESFYRYGYLVFGGGQVVVPVMQSEMVEVRQYLTNQEFLTGYGLVQGLPGPMFSFSAYVGGMAARGGSGLMQVLGAVAGGVGIFLPVHPDPAGMNHKFTMDEIIAEHDFVKGEN